VRVIPLQRTFHLKYTGGTITTIWVDKENRFRVTRISGGGDIIKQLKEHADEAGLAPTSIWDQEIDKKSEASWMVLSSYDAATVDEQSLTDEAFSELFDHLDVAEDIQGADDDVRVEAKLWMRKTNGNHTNSWVWKGTITEPSLKITP